MSVIQNILNQETQDGDKPIIDCTIVKSGVIPVGTPFEVSKEGVDWTV